jgi:hypothetical protein
VPIVAAISNVGRPAAIVHDAKRVVHRVGATVLEVGYS